MKNTENTKIKIINSWFDDRILKKIDFYKVQNYLIESLIISQIKTNLTVL